jgi:DNA topoisomerase-2
MKVAQLAAYVAEKSAYHHGEVSLAETIVKLANDYTGSNNINLLEPCGQFGTRLMGGKDASQTRYIFTRLSDETRKIFDPKDDAVLTYLDDDGRTIEPEHYMPVIPMVLVNGTEGIGTGFSCYVPPFNPTDIKENITNFMNGKELKKMKPWFRGFRGRIFEDEAIGWVTEGVWQVVGTTVKVIELPPGRWTQDYKEHLDILIDKKIITSFTNNSTTEDVDFLIQGYEGKDIVKDLKLQKTVRCTNMHLFHPTKGICKYNTPEDILSDFMDLRVDYYTKRKAQLIESTKVRSNICSYRAQFVKKVIEGAIVVFRKKKRDLECEIGQTFPKVDGSYDYLLHIRTVDYTEERVKALMDETDKLGKELRLLEATSCFDMWKNDIKNM